MRERLTTLAMAAYRRELSGLLESAHDILRERGLTITGASPEDTLRLVPDMIGPADALWVKYHRAGEMLAHVVALSIISGILDRDEIDDDLLQELATILAFYEKHPTPWNDWARGPRT